MNTKYILTSLALGLTVLLSSVSPALAQSPTLTPWQEGVQERREDRQERRELRRERRCDLVRTRIDARIRHFGVRRDNVFARQERIRERITEFVDRLEEKGYDVSKVRSDLETLDGMIQTANPNYAAFIKELGEVKHFDCNDSQDAFKQALEEARAALATFQSDVKAISDFIENTLRVDLQALREQNPSPSPTE